MRAAPALAALILLGGCTSPTHDAPGLDTPSASAPLPPLDTYSYRGTHCVELGMDVPVPAANVRPHVPPRYRLTLDPQGRATMAFAFARCDRMVAQDSVNASQVVQVDVGVAIEGGVYELAYTTNHAGIAQNASRAAFPAIHAPTSTLLGYPLQGADLVQAHIRGGNISLDVDATAYRVPAPTRVGGTYYHSGANGTSRMVYDVNLATLGPAEGKVTTQPGGLVAKIFGATEARATGAYGSFTLGANLTRLPN